MKSSMSLPILASKQPLYLFWDNSVFQDGSDAIYTKNKTSQH